MRQETLAQEAYDDFAPFYDLSHLGRQPEIDFYTSLVRKDDRSLLELGCGTGTIGACVAQTIIRHHGNAGRLVGIDRSTQMLAVARARYPYIAWVQGDMTTPPVSPGFDFVLCPFNTLQMLDSASELLRTLRSVRQLLSPDGIFVFDMYNNSFRETVPGTASAGVCTDRLARSFSDARGHELEVREDARQDPAGSFVVLDWRVVDTTHPEKPILARLKTQWRHYSCDDIEKLLEAAGLRLHQRYGDVRKSPFSATGSKKQVVICGR